MRGRALQRGSARAGPPGLVLDGESRSHSNEIVADYLAFAHSGRAWYLTDEGSSYERRWHAKCRTHSDCAVVRHKSRADGWQCPSCGGPTEDSTHVYLVYLECPAHSRRRGPLMCHVRKLCAAADGDVTVAARARRFCKTSGRGTAALRDRFA